MKIAISGALHGLHSKIENRYPDCKFQFIGNDRDKKPKAIRFSSNHIFIMRRFCSHSLYGIIKNNFGSSNITMVNGGLTELLKAIDGYLHKAV